MLWYGYGGLGMFRRGMVMVRGEGGGPGSGWLWWFGALSWAPVGAE